MVVNCKELVLVLSQLRTDHSHYLLFKVCILSAETGFEKQWQKKTGLSLCKERNR